MELQDHPGPICAPVRFVTVIWKKALSSVGAVLGTAMAKLLGATLGLVGLSVGSIYSSPDHVIRGAKR